MLKNKEYYYLSTYLVVFVSLLFALLVGSGFYGYGHDFYMAYHQPNLSWGGIFDRLGYVLSTLSINGLHIGVQVVTFILSLSTGFLIREHIKFKNKKSKLIIESELIIKFLAILSCGTIS